MNNVFDTIGIGVDISSISDFRKISYEQNLNFYKMIFHPTEIEYCLKFTDPYPHFSGIFSLKEAVKKSIPEEIFISKIKINHIDSKPNIILYGAKNEYDFRSSISHEKDYAIGFVISKNNT